MFDLRREDLRGTAQGSKVQSNMHALSSNVGEMVETATSKISCEQSLLQCHMCSQQGFTTVGLKVNILQTMDASILFCRLSRFSAGNSIGLSIHVHV